MRLDDETRDDIPAYVLSPGSTEVKKASVLFDSKPPSGVKRSPQCAHIDYRLRGNIDRMIWVAITALNSPFRLLIWPGSHFTMQRLAETHAVPDYGEPITDAEGKPIKDAEGNVTRSWEPDFLTYSSVEKDTGFALLFGLEKPVVVTIYPGQTLIFHGMTVHAGAPGQLKGDGSGEVEPCFRLHRYIMPIGDDIDLTPDGKVAAFPLPLLAPGLVSHVFAQRFYDISALV